MANLPNTPETRREQFLNAIATDNTSGLPEPVTREEMYLDYIAENGGGGGEGVTPAQVREIIAEQTDDEISSTSENPVQNKVVKDVLDSKANVGDVYTKVESDARYLQTANVDTELDNQSHNPVENVAITEAIDDIIDYVTTTKIASGNPINITDAAAYPAKECVTVLDPKQDLHGYNSPWVGGAGRNLLPLTLEGIKAANTSGAWSGNAYTINGVTFTILTDNDGNVTGIKVNGTASATANFINGIYSLSAGNYTLSGCPSNGSTSTYYMDWRDDMGGQRVEAGKGYTLTTNGQTDKAQRIIIVSGYNAQNLIFYPMIEEGNQVTAFAPYSNICTIDGYTGAELMQTGKNLCPNIETWERGFIDREGNIDYPSPTYQEKSSSYIYIKVFSSIVYSFPNGFPTGESNAPWRAIAFYDKNLTFLNRIAGNSSAIISASIPSNAAYIRLSYRTYGNENSPMLNEGIEAETYTPYQGKTTTITFPQEAGTIYGGEIDWVNGVLRVTKANIASYNGETLPGVWISDRDVYAEGAIPSIGAQVVYELATPIEIPFTPEVITLLEGENNVWTDSGEIEIEYCFGGTIGEKVIQLVEDVTGVYTKNASQDALLIDNASKNLLPLDFSWIKENNTGGTWNNNTLAIGNVTVTFEINNDNYVTKILINGTISTNNSYYIHLKEFSNIENYKTCLLTANSSEASSSNRHFLVISARTSLKQLGNSFSIPNILVNSEDDNYTGAASMMITLRPSIEFNNLSYQPMICHQGITDTTFEPYYRTQKQLDADINVLKRETNYNLLPSDNWYASESTAQIQDKITSYPISYSGMTIIQNADSSITITGQNTSSYTRGITTLLDNTIISGNVSISGCSHGVISSGYWVQIIKVDWTDTIENANGYTIGYLEPSENYYFRIRIKGNYTFPENGITFYPMITKVEYAGLPFKPYVPTNTELAKEVQEIEAFATDIKDYIGYSDSDVYGLEADFENGIFTRLAGAEGKTAGTDFDSINAFGGRRRCNLTDDGVVTAYYGDTAYTETGALTQAVTINGTTYAVGTAVQVMVEQPKFYYKMTPLKLDKQTGNGKGYHIRKARYYISDTPKSDFKVHPAFVNVNGDEVDYIYLSAYEGSLYDVSENAYITNDAQVADFANDKCCSISGIKPASGLTQDLTRPNIEAMCQNRGTEWHEENVQIVSMTQLLMFVEYGQFDFQRALANGVADITDNSAYNCSATTGSTAALGNTSGNATSTDVTIGEETTAYTVNGKVSISYRGQENVYGNIWNFVMGINIYGDGSMNGGEPYICLDYGYAESKNTDNYIGAGFTLPNTPNYISAFGYGKSDFDWLFMPSEATGGSNALPVGDYEYMTANLAGFRTGLLGGTWNSGWGAGGFYWSCSNGVNYHARNVGGRLVFIPSV